MTVEWNDLFMQLAQLIATKSSCLRRQCGAVIVRDNKVISLGYNGVPRGMAHCVECARDKEKKTSGKDYSSCPAVHAEQNAIIFAGLNKTKGSIMYVTSMPCELCCRFLINAEIEKVYFLYEDTIRELTKQNLMCNVKRS